MGMSKSTRILILLGIDSAFFLLELIVGKSFYIIQRTPLIILVQGYGVRSLALVADAFHMVGSSAPLDILNSD